MKEKEVNRINNCLPILMRSFKTSHSLRWLFRAQPAITEDLLVESTLRTMRLMTPLIPMILAQRILEEETPIDLVSGKESMSRTTTLEDTTQEVQMKLRIRQQAELPTSMDPPTYQSISMVKTSNQQMPQIPQAVPTSSSSTSLLTTMSTPPGSSNNSSTITSSPPPTNTRVTSRELTSNSVAWPPKKAETSLSSPPLEIKWQSSLTISTRTIRPTTITQSQTLLPSPLKQVMPSILAGSRLKLAVQETSRKIQSQRKEKNETK